MKAEGMLLNRTEATGWCSACFFC